MEKSAAELREELRQAEARERVEAEARKRATPVVYRFTAEESTPAWHKVYDPSCRLYNLRGEVVNREEAKAAGHSDHEMHEGGMLYLYNTLTERIVTSIGGGQIWIGANWNGSTGSDDVAFDQVSAFLAAHPEGGDITSIVQAHRKRVREAKPRRSGTLASTSRSVSSMTRTTRSSRPKTRSVSSMRRLT